MYSVFNYFKKVEKLETILDLQEPMAFVDKKHPSVKERFKRLKEKLLADTQKKELKKIKTDIEHKPKVYPNQNAQKYSTNDCRIPKTAKGKPQERRNRKLQTFQPNLPKNTQSVDKHIKIKKDFDTKEHKPAVKSDTDIKPIEKIKIAKKKYIQEPPKSAKNKPNNCSTPARRNTVSVKNEATFKKNEIANRMKKFKNQIASESKAIKSPYIKNLICKDRAIKKDTEITKNRESNRGNAKDIINKNYKIPKKKENNVLDSLPVLNADDDFMEVDPPDTNEEPNNVEEMDWEVNEIRKGLNDLESSRNSSFLGNNHGDPIELPLILVIDTNIYISSLPFVEKLCEIEVPGYGVPLVYVPRRVLCELNGLKDNERNVVKNPKVSKSARTAIHFLNSHLSKGSKRIKGQTLEQYKALENFNIDDSDDKILLSCLQLKQIYCDKRVILLSNDVNLRCKAIIESVDAFSANEFDDKVMSSVATNSMVHQIDAVLKTIFYEIICVECNGRKHFNVFKAAVAAFLSYWPDTFSYISPVAAEENLKRLKTVLDESKIDYVELIEVSKKFLNHFQIKSKSYYTKVEKALNQLNSALCQLKTIKAQEKNKKGCQALQEIFQQCWIILQDQLNKSYNQSSFSTLSDHISKIIVDFGNSINGILTFSSDEHVKMLASTIRICLNGNIETYCDIVNSAIRSEEGRDLLRSAAHVFEDAQLKISQVNSQVP